MIKIQANIDFNEDITLSADDAEKIIQKFAYNNQNIELNDEYTKSFGNKKGGNASIKCVFNVDITMDNPDIYVKKLLVEEFMSIQNPVIHNVQTNIT